MLTNCKQLKLPAADGKNYKTDVADLEQILRIIQSIPSKKAEPVKPEVATTEYSRQSNPQTMAESQRIAKEGGDVARDARQTMERRLGRSVVSPQRASDYLTSPEETEAKELPFGE